MDAQVSALPEPTKTSRRKHVLRVGLLTLAVVTLPHLVGLGQPLDQGTFASLLAQQVAEKAN